MQQSQEHFEATLTRRASLEYLLYLPDHYDADTAKRWPLMLFLHGAGERGSNLDLVQIHGPPKRIEQGQSFDFVVAAPQCAADQSWQSDTLSALLDEVIGQLRIDEDRIYLSGLSMGGYGAWGLAGENPGRFAALVPVCGGGTRQAARSIGQNRLPTWVFHGARDQVVPVDESERMVRMVEQFGGDVDFTVYPDADHDSWSETFANDEVYSWLAARTRQR